MTLVPQKMAVLYEAFCSWDDYKELLFVNLLAFNIVGLRDTVVNVKYNEDINESLCFEDIVSNYTGRCGIWIMSKWGRNKIKYIDHEAKQLRSQRLC